VTWRVGREPFRSERALGGERWNGGSVGEVEFKGLGVGGQGPTVGSTNDKTTLFKGSEGVTEAGVVDAEALTESSPGQGVASAAEFVAQGLGQRRGRGDGAIGCKAARLSISTGEAEHQGVGSRSGAVLDGETKALIVAAKEVTCGVSPGVEIGAAPEGLTEVAAGAFGHVVDEDDGEVVAAVELPEEAEEAGDI